MKALLLIKAYKSLPKDDIKTFKECTCTAVQNGNVEHFIRNAIKRISTLAYVGRDESEKEIAIYCKSFHFVHFSLESSQNSIHPFLHEKYDRWI